MLVNEGEVAWKVLQDSNQIVDIVMDNAGYELFTDLCLADFLVSSQKAKKVTVGLIMKLMKVQY